MQWLYRLSRQVGLMVHNIKHPEADGQNPSAQTHELGRTVVQKTIETPKVTTTLRRTTIDEVELRPNDLPRPDQPQDGSDHRS